MTAPDAGELELLAGSTDLAAAAARVAHEISTHHPAGVTLVAVLKGSVVFLADLIRQVTVPVRVDMVALSPFDGTSRRTWVVKDVDRPIAGEDVVLVTGITDTGLTADFLIRHLAAGDPASLELATLADKAVRRIVPVQPRYVGLEAPDRFLIGYGLDYLGRYRNLDQLWAVDGSSLAADPDRFVPRLYGERARPGT